MTLSFQKLWSVSTASEFMSTPAITTDGLLLIGSKDGVMNAYNTRNGDLIWRLHKNEPIYTNAAIADDMAFFGEGLHTTKEASLTAVSLPEGRPLWEQTFKSHLETPPTISPKKNSLWIAAGSEGLWSLNKLNGEVLWHNRIGHIDATPLLHNKTLFVPAQPEEEKQETLLFALEADNGTVKWKLQLPGKIMGSALLNPNLKQIVVTTALGKFPLGIEKKDKGWIHAADLKGNLLWSKELPTIPIPDCAILRTENIAVCTVKNGVMFAFDLRDGKIKWKKRIGRYFFAPVIAIEDINPPLIVARSDDGIVSISNAKNGDEYHRFTVEQGGYSGPSYSNRILFISTGKTITAYTGLEMLVASTKEKQN